MDDPAGFVAANARTGTGLVEDEGQRCDDVLRIDNAPGPDHWSLLSVWHSVPGGTVTITEEDQVFDINTDSIIFEDSDNGATTVTSGPLHIEDVVVVPRDPDD